LAHQLKRLAIRAALGVGVTGGKGENSSGDLMIAFSTANPRAAQDTGRVRLEMVPNDLINPLFYATVQATEEAIVNAMVAAPTMTGANGARVFGIPHGRLQAALRKYNRVSQSQPE
jgi:L-aminopeptidase/D-esterase-like protein